MVTWCSGPMEDHATAMVLAVLPFVRNTRRSFSNSMSHFMRGCAPETASTEHKAPAPAGSGAGSTGSADGTLDVSAAVTDHVCAYAGDISDKEIACDFLF